MRAPVVIDAGDQTAPGEARRQLWRLASEAGLNDEERGRAELVVTELATNLVKHAAGGWLILGHPEANSETLEILALDNGPGIEDIASALRDGHSTTGTRGTGLGAIFRQSDFFQVYSRPQKGTGIVARISRAETPHRDEMALVGGVSVPFRGEQVNGDGWACSENDGRRMVMVVDGLGHGYYAHDAAVAACEAFLGAKGSCGEVLRTIHEALRPTRGAAVAVAELDPVAGQVRFAGVGNISATMIDPPARRSAVSMHGIAGHEMRDVREFAYPWSRESSLVMHSDGLGTRWDLDSYPALLTRDPVLVAGILWKDHRRTNDDSTVVVARTP
ncbi:MAG TPA: ATP-binding protein [Thermoanaerobaculia bacterium]